MKFVAISDTHGQHHDLMLPPGDVLLHAGDITRKGKESEVIDFLKWFGALDFKHKIFIAGNHDFFFEKESREYIHSLIPESVFYLCDSYVAIDHINIWGSPVTPWFYNWAFNRHRGTQIGRHWDAIPSDIDILITHGPAYGILDKTCSEEKVGCKDLLEKIHEINPRYFVCGHIHEAYGMEMFGKTQFINASVLDEEYRLRNPPVVFEI